MTLWPPGAWPPERITPTLIAFPPFALGSASKVSAGLPKVVLKISRIFSTSATAVVGAPSMTRTMAP